MDWYERVYFGNTANEKHVANNGTLMSNEPEAPYIDMSAVYSYMANHFPSDVSSSNGRTSQIRISNKYVFVSVQLDDPLTSKQFVESVNLRDTFSEIIKLVIKQGLSLIIGVFKTTNIVSNYYYSSVLQHANEHVDITDAYLAYAEQAEKQHD